MPIYLYKKTHSITGLHYLGKTTQDPLKYKGSGTYWLRHLKKYGNLVTTEILRECLTTSELTDWGIYYSNLWNVVASNEWANLKPESGDGGSGIRKLETKRKISKTMTGRTAHNKGMTQTHKKHKSRSDNPNNGTIVSKLKGCVRSKIECLQCKRKIDLANFHRYHGDKCQA